MVLHLCKHIILDVQNIQTQIIHSKVVIMYVMLFIVEALANNQHETVHCLYQSFALQNFQFWTSSSSEPVTSLQFLHFQFSILQLLIPDTTEHKQTQRV